MNTEIRNYQVNGRQITITVERVDGVQGFIKSGKFRKEITMGHIVAQPSQISLQADFFSNMEFFISVINGREVDKSAFANALDKKLQVHVKEFGRLVDVDLEGFIDTIMFLADACSKTFYNMSFTKEQGEILRQEFVDTFVNRYYNHIWVNQRIPSSEFPFNKTKLVKLADCGVYYGI